nr:MAG TPA: hypothetical protein [Caudoviricetes sp.]
MNWNIINNHYYTSINCMFCKYYTIFYTIFQIKYTKYFIKNT